MLIDFGCSVFGLQSGLGWDEINDTEHVAR